MCVCTVKRVNYCYGYLYSYVYGMSLVAAVVEIATGTRKSLISYGGHYVVRTFRTVYDRVCAR